MAFAIPGTIVEFIKMSGMLSANSLRNILLIGAGYALVYFIFVWLYYGVLAVDFLEGKEGTRNRKELIKALGGISNLRIADGSPLSLSVAVYDTSRIKAQPLIDLGAYKVTESFYYHRLYFGPGSVRIARKLKKEIREYNGVKKYIEAK